MSIIFNVYKWSINKLFYNIEFSVNVKNSCSKLLKVLSMVQHTILIYTYNHKI